MSVERDRFAERVLKLENELAEAKLKLAQAARVELKDSGMRAAESAYKSYLAEAHYCDGCGGRTWEELNVNEQYAWLCAAIAARDAFKSVDADVPSDPFL